jgi:uncharacterized SAM-binding protein YcdF (DUF218 family)
LKMLIRSGVLREFRDLLEVYRGGSLSPRDPDAVQPRVAVVLGAQVLRGGRPSRTLEARTRHAGVQYARGEVNLLIPTGGEGRYGPSEAEVMAGILRGMGVPEEAILREDRARSTWESALLVAGIARDEGIGAVLVVTDPLHCVRTVAAFQRARLRATAEPVYSSPMYREKWLRRGQLLRESGALVWYRIRHGVGARSLP